MPRAVRDDCGWRCQEVVHAGRRSTDVDDASVGTSAVPLRVMGQAKKIVEREPQHGAMMS